MSVPTGTDEKPKPHVELWGCKDVLAFFGEKLQKLCMFRLCTGA